MLLLLAVRLMPALLMVLVLLVLGLVPAPGLMPLTIVLLLKMMPRLVVLAPLVVRRMMALLTPRQTRRPLLRLPKTAGRLGKPLVRMLVWLLLMIPMMAVLVLLPVQLLLPLLVEKVPRARTHMTMGSPQVVLVPRLVLLLLTPPMMVTMNRTIAAARAMTKTKGTTVKIWTSRRRWQG